MTLLGSIIGEEYTPDALVSYYMPLPSWYDFWPDSTPADQQTQAQLQAQAQAAGVEFCDRTSVLGKFGACEASQAARSVGEVANSPAVTFFAGAVALGAGTLAIVALANATGLSPVLKAGGRAAAAGIRSAGRALGA